MNSLCLPVTRGRGGEGRGGEGRGERRVGEGRGGEGRGVILMDHNIYITMTSRIT